MASRNLTVTELAKKSGIHYVMINRYLKGDRKGKVPSIDTLVELADALVCSLDELVGFKTPLPAEEPRPAFSEEASKLARLYDLLDDTDSLKKLLTLAAKSLGERTR